MTPQFEYVGFAQRSVGNYTSVKSLDIIQESKQAVDCLNCEAHLQNGVNAWNFILKADEAVHWSMCKEHIDDSEGKELLAAIDAMVIEWLGPCTRMMQWINRCESNDYKVDFKDEFLACLKEAKAIAKYDPQQPMPEDILGLRDAAVREHDDDQTVEFV